MTRLDSVELLPADIEEMRSEAILPLPPYRLWRARLLRLLVWLRRLVPWCVLLLPVLVTGCQGQDQASAMAGGLAIASVINNHHQVPDWFDLFRRGVLSGEYIIAPNIERGVEVVDLYGWVELPHNGHTLVICRNGRFCTEFVPRSGINYLYDQLWQRLTGRPWQWSADKIIGVLKGVTPRQVMAYFQRFGVTALDAISLMPLAVWCEMDESGTLCPRKGEAY